MSRYQQIPILDTARRCGISINNSTIGRTEVEASCPFCGDKERRYHLSLNTVKDQYRCFLCGAGGNSVSLYAKLKNITNAEAARELLSGGNVYPMPAPRNAASTEHEIKPARDRHDVYYEMLSHLVLSDRHLNDLRERGLSDERISMNMYRTLPKSEAARKFLAGMLDGFYDLSGIPGFHTNNSGQWTIAGNSGLLIPVCDSQGYIQGLQVRLDDEDLTADARGSKRRYRWLSSRYKENGTKSGTWIHITGNTSAKTAFLTEGPLKGDVASFLTNDALFICVAGINATDGLAAVIKSLGVTEILLAADMDKVTNPQVRQACKNITQKLLAMSGIRVRIASWDPKYKGIDDYRLAHVNGQSDSLIFEAA